MWDCERGAQSTWYSGYRDAWKPPLGPCSSEQRQGSLAELGRLAEGSYMLSSVGYSQFAVVAWARDELGGESFTGSSQGETAATIGFPSIENGGKGSAVVVWSMEGMGCGRDECQVSSSSAVVLTMLGEVMSLIVVIPHVNNGGCTKEGGDFGPGASGRDRCWIREGVAAAELSVLTASSSWRHPLCTGEGNQHPKGRHCRFLHWLSEASMVIAVRRIIMCGRLAPMSMRGVQGRGWRDGAGIRGNGWWESLSSSSYSITLVAAVSHGIICSAALREDLRTGGG
ncbi:hypothetical protein ARMSODRAFT_983846 [Armillaria solidipes]|uniref:Uncharacterized protein n=1 Tax=Armillaria solidipes TaxID=1076256 RepID=A0A2H3B3K7_9AGAR|nr:hypothetical protein ARMSODRAFT_983846 [Armillaria solidipes]